MIPKKYRCWWAYSKQCLDTNCRDCYMQYPVIRGLLSDPDWMEAHDDKIEGLMNKALHKVVNKVKHK